MKKLFSLLCLCLLLFPAAFPAQSDAQTGNYAHYDGWQTLTDNEKLCFILGYGYGTGNISISLNSPGHFVEQIDIFYEREQLQSLSVEELFNATNWLFLGIDEEKIDTFLHLRSKTVTGQKITIEELHHMENLRKEGEALENEIVEKLQKRTGYNN